MAYGILTIKYRNNDIFYRAKDVANEHGDTAEAADKFIDKLDSVREYSSRDYLQKASSFLRKRSDLCERKKSAATRFATQVSSFMDNAEQADNRVADHIVDTYEEFKKITGINNGGLWGAIVNFAKGLINSGLALLMLLNPVTRMIALVMVVITTIEAIKKWYENLSDEVKYWIKLIGSAIGVVLAVAAVIAAWPVLVAATGAAAIIAATLSLAGAVLLAIDSLIAFIQDVVVICQYNAGNEAEAARLSELETGEYFGERMEERGYGNAEDWAFGYNITMFCASICKITGDFSTKFMKIDKKSGTVFQRMGKVFKDSMPFQGGELSEGKSNWKTFSEAFKKCDLKTVFTMDIQPMLDVYKSFRDVYKFTKSVFVERFSTDWKENIGIVFDILPFNDWDRFINVTESGRKAVLRSA